MKISDKEQPISPAAHLLQSLIDSIPQVQTFKGKWSLIRSKLLTLQTHITDFSDFPSSPTNTLSLDLLRSIHHTLSDALSLCNSCKDINLPNGKLRTQNDVDSISTRLDRNIHDADLLLKSGVLDDAAVATSFSVRAESKCLITRLQIGSSESRNSAMDSLLILLHEDDKNVLIAVGQGIVPVLVRLLDTLSSHELKEKTVAALARVSIIDSNKRVLIDEGLLLLNNLCRLLESSGGGFAKEKACIVLQALSHAKENARAIGSRGGISSLLEICQSGTPSSQAAAAGVLRNLSEFAEIKENLIEENAIPILLSLSASGTSSAQENSIGSLTQLIYNDTQLKLFIAKEGGIESLKNYWDSSSTIRNLEVAVDLVKNLASCPLIAETLISDGFLNRLISLLNCGVLSVRTAAAKAIYELSFNSRTRKELDFDLNCNCIPWLVKMLDGKAVEEREAAAKALSSLMGYAGNRRMFRKEERGIVGTIQLLDPCVEKLEKKYPVLILTSLVKSNKCRKEMIAAGACIYLQKLGEIADVEGAKKLSESLGKVKIWGGLFGRP